MAPGYGTSDVLAGYDDAGVSVVLGVDTTTGLLEEVEEELLEGELASYIGRVTGVRVLTGVLTALALGASITVDSIAYKVHSFAALEPDRAETRIICVKET